MTYLDELLDPYLNTNTRITRQDTRDHYYRSVRQFSTYLGHRATLDDLNDDALAGWMVHTVRCGLTEVTANQRAKQIRALWSWAARRRLVERWPTVRGMREPELLPRAYTEEEVERLLSACRTAEGWVGPHRARDWWLSLHLFLWDTAERIGAALAIERDMIDLAQLVARVPARLRKGGCVSMTYRLTPATVASLEPLYQTPTDTGRVWDHHWRDEKTIYTHYRRLVERAGLRWDRRNSGFQKLRRTVLTMIEMRGGNATAFARHSSRRVTEQSYLDQGMLSASREGVWPQPPAPQDGKKRWWFFGRK